MKLCFWPKETCLCCGETYCPKCEGHTCDVVDKSYCGICGWIPNADLPLHTHPEYQVQIEEV